MTLQEMMVGIGYDASLLAFHGRGQGLNIEVVNRAMQGLPIAENLANAICDVMTRGYGKHGIAKSGQAATVFTPQSLHLVIIASPGVNSTKKETRNMATKDHDVIRKSMDELAKQLKSCDCGDCQGLAKSLNNANRGYPLGKASNTGGGSQGTLATMQSGKFAGGGVDPTKAVANLNNPRTASPQIEAIARAVTAKLASAMHQCGCTDCLTKLGQLGQETPANITRSKAVLAAARSMEGAYIGVKAEAPCRLASLL